MKLIKFLAIIYQELRGEINSIQALEMISELDTNPNPLKNFTIKAVLREEKNVPKR